MKLAFSLESWEACGGDAQMSGEEALVEGNEQIDAALEIFKNVRFSFINLFMTHNFQKSFHSHVGRLSLHFQFTPLYHEAIVCQF